MGGVADQREALGRNPGRMVEPQRIVPARARQRDIAQIAPLDVGSKQALLEASDLAVRADLLVQFMQFQRMAPGGADGPETLQ